MKEMDKHRLARRRSRYPGIRGPLDLFHAFTASTINKQASGKPRGQKGQEDTGRKTETGNKIEGNQNPTGDLKGQNIDQKPQK
jgi:hypothetical protein